MPTSKTYLPEVNVWIALAFAGHVHNPLAMRWFYGVHDEMIAFCRATQMGFLRLLTNAKVMGEEVRTKPQAWEGFDQFLHDPRVSFLPEPAGVEEDWRSLTLASNNLRDWTDAYVLAFAKARGLQVVTFDQRLAVMGGADAVLIAAGDA